MLQPQKCVQTAWYFVFGTKKVIGLPSWYLGWLFWIGCVKTPWIAFRSFSAKLIVKHQMQYSVLLQIGIKIVDSQWRKILNRHCSYVWLVLPEDSWTIKTGSYFEMQWRFAFLLSFAGRITNESANQSDRLLYTTTLLSRQRNLILKVVYDLMWPYWKDLPKSSVNLYEIVRSVSRDATHMTVRCVENNLLRSS